MNALSLFDNFIRYPYKDQTAISGYLFGDTYTPVRVISDTQYQEILKAQAEREVAVLENQRNRYLTHIEQLDIELTKVKTEAGLLPAADPEESKDS